MKIAILHHTGGGNLGDDAIMDSVLDNIRRRWPHASLTAFSMNPQDTTQKHGIPSIPIRTYTWKIGYAAKNVPGNTSTKQYFVTKALRRAVRILKKVAHNISFLVASFCRLLSFDMLIISGGGQLTERSGPWGFPYAIFVWIQLARIAGVKRIFLNVGAGPLRHPLSKFFTRQSLNAANYVSFRDVQSQELAQSLGFRGNSQVFPDNVYSSHLNLPKPSGNAQSPPLVGIAPMPWPFCDPREYAHEDLAALYKDYLSKLATFSKILTSRPYTLEPFGSDIGADQSAMEDLRNTLQKRHSISLPHPVSIHSVDGLLTRMAAMDYIVTCRYHGVVLAHLLNKPVLAIAHHPKVTDLMHALGLAQYCVDIRTFDPLRLADTFDHLVLHAEAIKNSMTNSLQHYRAQSTAQFDALFPADGVTALHTQQGIRLSPGPQ